MEGTRFRNRKKLGMCGETKMRVYVNILLFGIVPTGGARRRPRRTSNALASSIG